MARQSSSLNPEIDFKAKFLSTMRPVESVLERRMIYIWGYSEFWPWQSGHWNDLHLYCADIEQQKSGVHQNGDNGEEVVKVHLASQMAH